MKVSTLPEHEVVRAAQRGDPTIVTDAERSRREMLELPPFGALAEVTGAGAADLVAQLDPGVVAVGRSGDDRYVVRAADWTDLGRELNRAERLPGTRVRVAVDPPRI